MCARKLRLVASGSEVATRDGAGGGGKTPKFGLSWALTVFLHPLMHVTLGRRGAARVGAQAARRFTDQK